MPQMYKPNAVQLVGALLYGAYRLTDWLLSL